MIRTAIFDLGRVVLWFDNDIFLRKLADRAERPFAEVRRAAHANIPLIREFDGGGLTPRQFYERVGAAVGVEVGYDFFYEVYNDIFSLNEPVLDIVRRLKAAGVGLVLLSNTDPERYGFVRRAFPQIFVFDDYVLSYEVRLLKPDPAIFREAVRRAGVRPGECVFIDDMEDNVNGATSAGLRGIHYRPETDLEAELNKLCLVF